MYNANMQAPFTGRMQMQEMRNVQYPNSIDSEVTIFQDGGMVTVHFLAFALAFVFVLSLVYMCICFSNALVHTYFSLHLLCISITCVNQA